MGSFFTGPQYPEREPRPKAINPLTGREQSFTRASSFVADLDNPHGLIKSQGRNLIRGLALRPDLVRMIAAGVPLDDNTKTDEIVTSALAAMATDAAANEGTAAHSVLVRSWTHQEEMLADEHVPLVEAFARALKEHGLTPKAAELKVLNLTYSGIGTFDWVMQESDGTHVIGDVKTGKLDAAKRKFAAQLAVYDGAEFVVHADGSVSPIPWKLARTHGVLIHIDLENGNAVSVYRVDLNIGRYGAGLAEQVRQWHKLDPLTPYVRPVVSVSSTVDRNSVVGEIEVTEPRPASAAVVLEDAGDVRTDPQEAPVTSLPAPSAPEITASTPALSGAEDTGRPEIPYDPDARFDALMGSMDKAKMQAHLKREHQWTDSNHNRRWLARAIVVLEQGWTDTKMIVKYAAAKDGETVEPAPPQVGAFTEDAPAISPETIAEVERFDAAPEQQAAVPPGTGLLQAIVGANSDMAIEALRRDIVERRGDQAWTEEHVAATRARCAELPVTLDTDTIMGKIDRAAKQEDLKDLWQLVTIGGSLGERWTPEMTSRGKGRLAAIAAALAPAPTNPFGD